MALKICRKLSEKVLQNMFKYREMTSADNAAVAALVRNNLQAAIHNYEKSGYVEIDRPAEVNHSTMNRFFRKVLEVQS